MSKEKKTLNRLSFAQREEKILKSASSLFSKNGFKGTTTKAIASHAKINEALLFRHFKNKQAMYTALIKQKLDKWQNQIIPTLESFQNSPIEELLKQLALTIINEHERDQNLCRIMFFSSLEHHRMGPLFFKQPQPLNNFFESYLKAKMKSGEIHRGDAGIMAKTFLSMVFHYVLIKDLFKAESFYGADQEQIINHFIKIFLNGILS